MNRKLSICLIFLIIGILCTAQPSLVITKTKFGRTKVSNVYRGEIFRYKKKHDLFYHKEKLVHMQDSLLIFASEGSINIKDLRAIRIERNVHLLATMESYFLLLGIGFFGLNTVNNIILNDKPIVSWPAAAIGGGLVFCSQVFRLLRTRKIRIDKNTVVNVVDVNYQELRKEQ